jgi:hypothetical protein
MKEPAELFALFWTEEIWDHLVELTNTKVQRGNVSLDSSPVRDPFSSKNEEESYSEDSVSESDSENSVFESDSEPETQPRTNFTPVTKEELKTWFAIWLVIGLRQNSRTEDFWASAASNGGVFSTDFITDRMSRERWKSIKTMLSANLDFVRTKILSQIKNLWIPKEHVTVDETLVLFKGRFKYRQHIRGKPNATGLKMYSLADTSGFVYDFWMYQGKKAKVTDIVTTFTSKLPLYPYKVYCDSYFGSLDLAKKLNERYYFLIACQKSRPSWLFADELNKRLQKKEYDCLIFENEIMAMSYKDKKTFNLITNFGSDQVVSNKKGTEVPERIDNYNQFCHGVDKADRWINMYMPRFRNRSWKFAWLIAMFYVACSNCSICWNDAKQGKSDLRAVLINLALNLSPNSQKKTTKQQKKPPKLTPSQIHCPVPCKQARCEFCKQSNLQSKATTKCMACDAILHIKCFFDYHNRHFNI